MPAPAKAGDNSNNVISGRARKRTRGAGTRKIHESNEKPIGQWDEYEITLNKGDLELKVNSLVQNRATDCQEIPGKICLQSEGGALEFRNIVLIPVITK